MIILESKSKVQRDEPPVSTRLPLTWPPLSPRHLLHQVLTSPESSVNKIFSSYLIVCASLPLLGTISIVALLRFWPWSQISTTRKFTVGRTNSASHGSFAKMEATADADRSLQRKRPDKMVLEKCRDAVERHDHDRVCLLGS